MGAGLPCVEFEAYGRIAPDVRDFIEKPSSTNQKQYVSRFATLQTVSLKLCVRQAARSRHSYRPMIREAIRRRLEVGESLSIRAIVEEAGGGSLTTVQEELKTILVAESTEMPALIGLVGKSLPDQIVALKDTVALSINHERILKAENNALKAALQDARDDVAKLLATHQDSQRMLLQGVDDLRQMVRAGHGSGLRASAQPLGKAPDINDGGILWKAKYDQQIQRYIELEKKNRDLMRRLNEHGLEWE